LQSDHSSQLKKETDDLKKDKEVTVAGLNESHSSAIKQKEESHKQTVQSMNESFESKLSKKE
jgi:hypothetical protein